MEAKELKKILSILAIKEKSITFQTINKKDQVDQVNLDIEVKKARYQLNSSYDTKIKE